MKKMYFSVLAAAWILAGCAVQPGDGRGGASQITVGSPTGSQYACFITGKTGAKASMKVFGSAAVTGVIPSGFDKTGSITVADGAGAKSRSVSYNSKTVLFDGVETPPAPYPSAFDLGGKRYMLFGWGKGEFSLYEFQSEDDTNAYFVSSTLWNFSNISNFVKAIIYKGDNNAWIMSPSYSDARKTLYFTICWWVEDAVKGDYIKMRIFESSLNGGSFGTPAELRGEINPYHPVHYKNNQWHTAADFPNRMGLWWIGRMVVTSDGKKAFFNCLNTMSDCGIMKLESAFVPPVPNNHNMGGLMDLHDARLIWTYICSADIADDGSFTNIRQLSTNINRGGVNFLCDISDDGSTLYAAHMTLDSTFWSFGWGPDGMARECCENDLYNVEPWTGDINVYQNPEYPYPGNNMIRNGSFSSGALYWGFWTEAGASGSMDIVNGEFKATILNGGVNIWSVGISQPDLNLVKDKVYFFTFRARKTSPNPVTIRALFQFNAPNWTCYTDKYFDLTQDMQTYSFVFKMTYDTDPIAALNFHIGKNNTGDIYFDDISLYETNLILPNILPYADVRNQDLSKEHLGYDLIKTLGFNNATIFSAEDQAYADQIMEKGKNPGLGVNYLHSQGITGQGVNVAIIDQNLCQDFGHPEYSGKIASYRDFGTGQPVDSGSMHAPAVASLLVGAHTGTAPGAKLYFAATPTWIQDAMYFVQALDWIIAQNAGLPATNKIRVVSFSGNPSGSGSPFTNGNAEWDQAVQRASAANILVLDCGAYQINDRGYCDLDNPDDITKFKPGTPSEPSSLFQSVKFYVPAPCRTKAEEYNNGIYAYYYANYGGYSWCTPYMAGVLAMGWQVNPYLSIAKITNYLVQTVYVNPAGYKVINPTNFIKTIQINLTADIKAMPGAVWVSPGSQSVANGNTTFIEIHVNTSTSSLAGYNIELTYNSAILGAPVVTACPTGFVTTTDTTTPGTIKVTGAYAAGKGPGTDLAVFRVTFTAIGSGTSNIGVKVNSLTDQTNGTIGTRNNLSGSITVN